MTETKKFILRNMLSKSCIRLVDLHFKHVDGVAVNQVFLGEATLTFDTEVINRAAIEQHFESIGFHVVRDPEEEIVEKTKIAAIELIHYANNTNGLIRNSDYISERVQLPYERISKAFSSNTGLTLEKYIILLKIEKAKQMLIHSDYTLSEISYVLGYSSVQYLSNQFKKTTGYTVSQFRELVDPPLTPLEEIIAG
ncbi:MAG: helix-turn-helix transcriptional regulator [Flavobacteriales bacterium]|nr:helix-turn-helix transcriptional regulator [Flavobacteriales bacterium]MCB9448511.1 helix-turn-helix transcriptional regulator [Flavobacteriales bacterium]